MRARGGATTAMIRTTYELEPHGLGEALALEVSLGMSEGPAFVRERVVSEAAGRCTVELPATNWGPNLPALVSAVVAGEAVETAAFEAGVRATSEALA